MICTRFAPSPTGALHIGGVRTALFCWLYAKRHNGKFILRIEDTDKQRSTQAATDIILQGMQWLGLDWDEGPIYQSQRDELYKAAIAKLLTEGKAYKCNCTTVRLDELREQQRANGLKPKYDGYCKTRQAEIKDNFVIRFANPSSAAVVFKDAVLGEISISNKELDDLIIARSDGSPTYQLTVVVDDLAMQVSHVIRGSDHLNNTPRQINLIQALGGKAPVYAHIPMILGEDGKKLSKRHGATNLMDYREQGFLPAALLNYLVRLGWSFKDQEIFSLLEMQQLFSLDSISKSAAAINMQKLLWLNQHYIQSLPVQELRVEIEYHASRQGLDLTQGPSIEDLLVFQQGRCKTLVELMTQSKFLYANPAYNPEAVAQHITEQSRVYLQSILDKLSALHTWSADELKSCIKQVVAEHKIGFAKVAQPIRVCVSGDTTSPSVDLTLEILGRQRSIARIQHMLTSN